MRKIKLSGKGIDWFSSFLRSLARGSARLSSATAIAQAAGFAGLLAWRGSTHHKRTACAQGAGFAGLLAWRDSPTTTESWTAGRSLPTAGTAAVACERNIRL